MQTIIYFLTLLLNCKTKYKVWPKNIVFANYCRLPQYLVYRLTSLGKPCTPSSLPSPAPPFFFLSFIFFCSPAGEGENKTQVREFPYPGALQDGPVYYLDLICTNGAGLSLIHATPYIAIDSTKPLMKFVSNLGIQFWKGMILRSRLKKKPYT